MTRTPIIFALLLATGCASLERPAVTTTPTPVYMPTAAAALAFDVPASIGTPAASLARDGRAHGAFAGYEGQITVYSYTHQRDEIRVDTDRGSLRRRAYTDRTSITTR